MNVRLCRYCKRETKDGYCEHCKRKLLNDEMIITEVVSNAGTISGTHKLYKK